MSLRAAVFTLSIAISTTVPAFAQMQPPSPAPVATVDPAITARAKEWLHRLQTGDIDRTQLDAKMNTLLTPAMLKQFSAAFGPWGDPVTFSYVGQQTVLGDNTAYVFHVVFKANACSEIFVLDKGAKISGFRLAPTQ